VLYFHFPALPRRWHLQEDSRSRAQWPDMKSKDGSRNDTRAKQRSSRRRRAEVLKNKKGGKEQAVYSENLTLLHVGADLSYFSAYYASICAFCAGSYRGLREGKRKASHKHVVSTTRRHIWREKRQHDSRHRSSGFEDRGSKLSSFHSSGE
jgi:hypothetical protein